MRLLLLLLLSLQLLSMEDRLLRAWCVETGHPAITTPSSPVRAAKVSSSERCRKTSPTPAKTQGNVPLTSSRETPASTVALTSVLPWA